MYDHRYGTVREKLSNGQLVERPIDIYVNIQNKLLNKQNGKPNRMINPSDEKGRYRMGVKKRKKQKKNMKGVYRLRLLNHG